MKALVLIFGITMFLFGDANTHSAVHNSFNYITTAGVFFVLRVVFVIVKQSKNKYGLEYE